MAHTPAPWTVHQYENGTLTIAAHEPDGTPCNPARINGDPQDSVYGPPTWANARLIAAAPELLEALCNLLCFASPGGLHGAEPEEWSDQAKRVCATARAAIAKATDG